MRSCDCSSQKPEQVLRITGVAPPVRSPLLERWLGFFAHDDEWTELLYVPGVERSDHGPTRRDARARLAVRLDAQCGASAHVQPARLEALSAAGRRRGGSVGLRSSCSKSCQPLAASDKLDHRRRRSGEKAFFAPKAIWRGGLRPPLGWP
jgi:hypothetical protein